MTKGIDHLVAILEHPTAEKRIENVLDHVRHEIPLMRTLMYAGKATLYRYRFSVGWACDSEERLHTHPQYFDYYSIAKLLEFGPGKLFRHGHRNNLSSMRVRLLSALNTYDWGQQL